MCRSDKRPSTLARSSLCRFCTKSSPRAVSSRRRCLLSLDAKEFVTLMIETKLTAWLKTDGIRGQPAVLPTSLTDLLAKL